MVLFALVITLLSSIQLYLLSAQASFRIIPNAHDIDKRSKESSEATKNATAKNTQPLQRTEQPDILNETTTTTTTGRGIAANATTKKMNQSSETQQQPETRNKTTPTENINWGSYRLGDWVLGSDGRIFLMQPQFRDSLAWEYAIEVDRRTNGTRIMRDKKTGEIKRPTKYLRAAICDIVKKRGKEQQQSESSPPLPQPGDLVLHLRLGDTLDEMMLLEEAEDAFEYGVSIIPSQIRNMVHGGQKGWWHYVKSKCYYENALKKFQEAEAVNATAYGAARKRVIIVGSAMHKKTASSHVSIKYTEAVQRFFVNQGFEVTTRLDGLPDDDMVWMSHAPAFIAAGGGFSMLASECVDYLGGVSLRPSNHEKKSLLEESCWLAPKPSIDLKNYSWESLKWRGKGGLWRGNKNYPPEKTVW